jgi:hypothetical protein
MVPMVQNLVSSPQVLSKRALILKIQIFPLLVKLPSALVLSGIIGRVPDNSGRVLGCSG